MSEFIGKLCPQSCQPIRLGGEPMLSAADIAHACTNLNDMGYLIISIKHGGDNSGFAALQDKLSKRIKDEAERYSWKKSRLPCLVKLAVKEYCGCESYIDQDRADAIGISRPTWSRIWKTKYKRLLEILEAYEQGAIHTIRNKL